MMRPRYLSTAETAKLVRKALKTEFPGQKFWVKSQTYSGGGNVRIEWIDGPTRDEVDAVVAIFAGTDFDASIDLPCYYNHWLLPDGTVQVAKCNGTRSSMGYIDPIDNPKLHPQAELVSLGAGYIFTNRYHTPEFVQRVKEAAEAETGNEAPEIIRGHFQPTKATRIKTAEFKWDYRREDYWSTFFSKQLHETSDYQKPEPKAKHKDNGSNGEARVELDRDWLWVYFPQKPDAAVLSTLKELGGRFSRKRNGWYFQNGRAVQAQVEAVV